jgi:hypothetical protein
MLLVNNTIAFNKTGSAMMMGNKAAVLLSPLEIQTDILHLPPLPQKQREIAIRRELRSRYPGNTDTADIDYFLLPQSRSVAVFTAEQETGLRYREKQGPVIPGLAFLLAGQRAMGKDRSQILLVTPDWIETASFIKGELTEHFAIPRKNAASPPDLFENLPAEAESGMIILRDQDETDDYILSLKQRYVNPRIINISDLFQEINVRKCTVFRRKNVNRFSINKKTAASLPVVYGLFLLLSIVILTAKAENSMAVLEQTYDENKSYHDEMEMLLAEIKALENPESGADSNQDSGMLPDPYTIVAEIHSRIRGAQIHSIIIQGEKFSFEAESQDALRLLKGLGDSPYFTNITLHQTVPLSADKEQFSVSGRIRNE